MERPWAVFLNELRDMGFPENRAIRALVATHNTGIEPAVNWLVEHAEDEHIDEPLDLDYSRGEPSREAVGVASPSEFVLGVPSDLPVVINPDDSQAAATFSGVGECKESGEKTVVLGVGKSAELQALQEIAATLQLPSYLVRDAGRTEVAGGTATVLAIGGVSEIVDRVTGHLSTL